jgi:hypothetical protein
MSGLPITQSALRDASQAQTPQDETLPHNRELSALKPKLWGTRTLR